MTFAHPGFSYPLPQNYITLDSSQVKLICLPRADPGMMLFPFIFTGCPKPCWSTLPPFTLVGWWLMPPRRRETQIQGHSDCESETSESKSSLPRVLPSTDTERSAGQMHLLTWEELFVDILNSMNSECVCIWRQSLERNYEGRV